MPRLVDHAERQAAIAQAVIDVVSAVGAERATVRAVAQRGGWSTGVLAHYFDGKDDMLAFAITQLRDRFALRVSRLDKHDHRGWTRGVLLELLPLTAEHRAELLTWFAFVNRASSDDRVTAAVRAGNRDLERAMAAVLTDASARGSLCSTMPPLDLAVDLLCFADGLALRHVFDPRRLSRAELTRLVDVRIAQLFDH